MQLGSHPRKQLHHQLGIVVGRAPDKIDHLGHNVLPASAAGFEDCAAYSTGHMPSSHINLLVFAIFHRESHVATAPVRRNLARSCLVALLMVEQLNHLFHRLRVVVVLEVDLAGICIWAYVFVSLPA